MTQKPIGKLIKEMREERGISQNQLAKKAGVSQSGLSAIENTTKSPSTQTVTLLAKALGVSPQAFFESERGQRMIWDDDALELMEEMHKRPELKALFCAAKNVTKEDIALIDQMIKRMASYDDEA